MNLPENSMGTSSLFRYGFEQNANVGYPNLNQTRKIAAVAFEGIHSDARSNKDGEIPSQPLIDIEQVRLVPFTESADHTSIEKAVHTPDPAAIFSHKKKII